MALTSSLTLCEILEPPQNVNIPDEAFLSALIDLGIDTNEDGAINTREAEDIPHMDISDRGISDMTGIEAFTDLERLLETHVLPGLAAIG